MQSSHYYATRVAPQRCRGRLSPLRADPVLAPFSPVPYARAMPRDGAIILTDLQAPFLHLVCEPCGRRGRYAVGRLIAERGDARLTDLLPGLANCSRVTNSAASIYDRRKAGFEATIPRYRPVLPPDE